MCYIAYIQTDSLLPYFSKCSDFLCKNVDLCLSVNDNAEIRVLGLHKEMADKRKLQGNLLLNKYLQTGEVLYRKSGGLFLTQNRRCLKIYWISIVRVYALLCYF